MVDHYEPSSYYEAKQLMLSKGVSSKKASAPLFEVDFYSQKAKGLVDFGSYEDYLSDYVTNAVKSTASNPTRTQSETPETRSTVRPVIEIAYDMGHPYSPVGTISSDPGFTDVDRSGIFSTDFAKNSDPAFSSIKVTPMHSSDPGVVDLQRNDPNVVIINPTYADARNDYGLSPDYGAPIPNEEEFENNEAYQNGILEIQLQNIYDGYEMFQNSYENRFGETIQYQDDAVEYFTNFDAIQAQWNIQANDILEELRGLKASADEKGLVEIESDINFITNLQKDISVMYQNASTEAIIAREFDDQQELDEAVFHYDMLDKWEGSTFRAISTEIAVCDAVIAMDGLDPEDYQKKREWLLWSSVTPQVIATMTDADYQKMIENEVNLLYENEELTGSIMLTDDAEDIDAIWDKVHQNNTNIKLNNAWEDIYKEDAFNARQEIAIDDMDLDARNAVFNIPIYEYAKIFANKFSFASTEEAIKASETRESLDEKIAEARSLLRDQGFTDEEIDDFVAYTNKHWISNAHKKEMEDADDFAHDHWILASLKSLFFEILRPIESIDIFTQKVRKLFTGSDAPINRNTYAAQFGDASDTMRDTVAEDIADKTGSDFLPYLYRKVMNAADIAIAYLTGEAVFGAGLGKIGQFSKLTEGALPGLSLLDGVTRAGTSLALPELQTAARQSSNITGTLAAMGRSGANALTHAGSAEKPNLYDAFLEIISRPAQIGSQYVPDFHANSEEALQAIRAVQNGSMNLTADESRAVMEQMVNRAVNGARSSINPAAPLENTGNTEYNGNQSTTFITSGIRANEGAGENFDPDNVLTLSTRFVNKMDPMWKNSENIKPIEGYQDIVSHGNKTNFAYLDLDGNEISMTPREFAEILRNSPVYNGGPIRLISCQAGAEGSMNAQYIANQLGVNVLAPTHTVFVYPDGEMFVGPSIFERTGTWIIFKPQGK